MKIDWKHKLTSRKFWSAVVGFITPTLLAFGATDSTAAQVTAIIMGMKFFFIETLDFSITTSHNHCLI